MGDLVDRDAALEALDEAFARAASGVGQVVAVTGEAGIGKSALVRQFVRDLPRDVRVLQGTCDDLLTPRPLAPFHDVARQVGGALAEALRSGAGRDDLHHALLDTLSHLPPPPVLVLEDLHWADEATLDAVTMLGRRVGDLPLLLLATQRSDAIAPDHPLARLLAGVPPANLHTVRLAPLSVTAVRRLVGDVEVDADRLHSLTGGNPFYVTEVLAGDGVELPPSVGFAVTARLQRLPADTQELLQVLSLVPGRVRTQLLDRLEPRWSTVLDPAEAVGMVELQDDAVAFRHELARHAVVSTTTRLFARRHHARILAALTELGADAATLVHHAEGAGDTEAVRRHAQAAAETAHRAESHREAVAHYERALARPDDLPADRAAALWFGLSRARMAADQPEHEAVDAADRAVAIARDLGEPRRLGRALANLARVASWAADNHRAARLAEEAVDRLAPLGPSADLAEAMVTTAYLRLAFWDFPGAVAWATRSIEVADQVGEPAVAGLAEAYLGVVDAGATGDTARVEAALAHLVDLGHHRGAVEAFITAGTALVIRRDHAAALALLDRGVEFAEAHEYATWALYMRVLRAQTFLETGSWAGAEVELDDVLAGMRTRAWPRASAMLVRGRLRARRGHPAAAEDLAEAWTMARDFAVLQLRYGAAAAIAELAWLEDRLDAPPPELLEVRDGPDVAAWPAVRGELALWLQRAGADPGPVEQTGGPWRAMLEGRWVDAAEAWTRRGCVYEAAEAVVESGDPERILRALTTLDELGAAPLARRARARLRALGVRAPRGPARATRRNPAGLTTRQAEVLELVLDGATNAEIADQLVVSVRTVDHHVSAVLQKLGVSSRRELPGALGLLPDA